MYTCKPADFNFKFNADVLHCLKSFV